VGSDSSDPIHGAAKAAFWDALDLTESARRKFVEKLAEQNPALARTVEGLLAAHERSASEVLGFESSPSMASSRSAGLQSGDRFEDYELLEEISQGGSGTVWKARQLSLQRIVALKVLRSGRAANAAEQEKLRKEAEAAARLDHPHIVPIYEVGHADGLTFFSMKWIEGGTLAAQVGSPWSPYGAARLLIVVARAIHHAHQRGVLHRDLKPSNVLLDSAGAPFIADFGIALRLDMDLAHAGAGIVAGTPSYMAPEQLQRGELTVATDIWAIGCILYELLSGRRAFEGTGVRDTLQKVLHSEPVPLKAARQEMPRDLEAIVAVCLKKSPAERYSSADALADDLHRWLQYEPISARRTGAWERIALQARRSPLAATLLGIVSGLVLLLAIVATWSSLELSLRLREQYLEQARVTRRSGIVGARGRALDLLDRARGIRSGTDLRDEMLACLALSDLSLEKSFPLRSGQDIRGWADHALRRIAVAEEEDLVLIDGVTGLPSSRLPLHGDVVFARWSPDDRWLGLKVQRQEPAGLRFHVQVWDCESAILALESPENVHGRSIEFSRDSSQLFTVSSDGIWRTYDLKLRSEVHRSNLGEPVNAILQHPSEDALMFLMPFEPWRIEVRSPLHGSLIAQWGLPALPMAAAWTGREREFAVGCSDGATRIYSDGHSSPRLVLTGHAAEVVDVIACREHALIATYSWDETTRLWNTLTGKEIVECSARGLGFDRIGGRFASLESRSFSMWRVEHGGVRRAATGHEGKGPFGITMIPGSTETLTVGLDGAYHWDAARPDPPRRISAAPLRAGVAFSDGSTFACGADGLYQFDSRAAGGARRVLQGDFCDLAGSSTMRAAILERDGVQLLDLRTMEKVGRLEGAGRFDTVSISGDGRRVVAGSWRGRGVHIWDLEAGDPPRILLPEEVTVSAAISPDGRIVGASTGSRFLIMQAEDGKILFEAPRMRAFGMLSGAISFSSAGPEVAWDAGAGRIRILDLRTFALSAELESPDRVMYARLAYSQDGRYLGAASVTNLIEVWDLDAARRALTAR